MKADMKEYPYFAMSPGLKTKNSDDLVGNLNEYKLEGTYSKFILRWHDNCP